MRSSPLLQIVDDRLAEAPPIGGADVLVRAAFEGPASLAAALGEGPAPAAIAAERALAELESPQVAFLDSISVEGFRGVGPEATLQLSPGPGLTLVVGRNGSGKSSFAEALELLLTGSSGRWAGRTRVWLDGWRNLHHPTARITATFTMDGRRQPARLRRTWTDESNDPSGSTLAIDGKRVDTLASLGWTNALVAHRPLLSHNELGRVLEEPSKLYDALASLLGLEELATAQRLLSEARLKAERRGRTADDLLSQLRHALERIDDERARTCLAATKGRQWDLATVERSLTAGTEDLAQRTVQQRLRGLSDVGGPTFVDAVATAEFCRQAARKVDATRGTSSGAARETAGLLEAALSIHQNHDLKDCPVCGNEGALTFKWRLATQQRVDELQKQAQAADAAHRAAQAARQRAISLLASPPALLLEAEGLGIDIAPTLSLWQGWSSGVELAQHGDLTGVADHLVRNTQILEQAIRSLEDAARAEFERREDQWRPAAQAIMAWLPEARAAQVGRARVPSLKAAETWLKDAHNDIRNQRFAPIAAQVQENWSTLRQASNVTLGELSLSGSASMRRLNLDVTIDGSPGSALGVMSQGELNCLALSLFLPRASMPESPFRFMVIDDPVQAMDPTKVEGLARVLERVSQRRQVVVFTHDDRLPEAVRRLDIGATVLEVTRREQSIVGLRRVLDPVSRHIDDARAVAMSNVPREAHRVVPGFCRLALEAACAEAITRRMLRQGSPHIEVDAALEGCTTLMTFLALALLRDSSRGGDVLNVLSNHGWSWARDAVTWCNRGSHESVASAEVMDRIRAVEDLAARLVEAGAKA